MAKGQQEKAFDDAIFNAEKGELDGPVKTQFGYYVFEVTRSRRRSSSRSRRPRRRSRTCSSRRTSRRRSTTSSRTSARSTRTRRSAPRTTSSRTARTRRRRRRTPARRRAARRRSAPPQGAAAGQPPARCRRAQPAGRAAAGRSAAGPARPGAAGLARVPDRAHGGRALAPRRDHPPPAGASARGTASRTSARSCRTRSRRPTSWPTPRTSGDDAKLLDELGDVLFQVYFLSLLLEERGAGDLAEVADHCREKLIRRHPHVFGDASRSTRAAGVVRNWDEIKRDDERGGELFGDVPENLPSLSYARKVQRQAGRGAARRRSQIVGDLLLRRPSPSRARWRSTPSSRCARPPTGSRRSRGSLSEIQHVHARQVLDSRGNPTVEVEVGLESGAAGRAAVPVRRLDRRVRGRRAARRRRGLGGKGVTKAVANVNGEIATAVTGLDAADQAGPRPGDDRARRHAEQGAARRQRDPRRVAGRGEGGGRGGGDLPLWRYLGGEAAHVLPVPMMNVLNGGAHADNKVDFQEFMVVPVGFELVLRGAAGRDRGLPRAEEDAARPRPRHGRRRRGRLRARPRVERGGARGADGRASRRPATSPARTIAIALDPATSEIYAGRRRTCSSTRAARCPPRRWPTTGPRWPARYPIVSIEDGMDEDDWDGWKTLTDRLGDTRPARRRRPVRHEHRAAAAGDRARASPTRSS